MIRKPRKAGIQEVQSLNDRCQGERAKSSLTSFMPGTREPEMHTAIMTIEPSSIHLQVCFFAEFTR